MYRLRGKKTQLSIFFNSRLISSSYTLMNYAFSLTLFLSFSLFLFLTAVCANRINIKKLFIGINIFLKFTSKLSVDCCLLAVCICVVIICCLKIYIYFFYSFNMNIILLTNEAPKNRKRL